MMSTATSSPASDGHPDLEQMLRPSGALLRAQTMLTRAFDLHVASHAAYDPTTLDLLTRIRLSDDRELRAVDLCDQLQKSPSHVSRIIDGAEAEGLVRRRPDPGDRRAHLVVLTDKGSAVVDELVPHIAALVDRAIFGALTPGEIERLVELLDKITTSTAAVISD